jgi:hypothetical protein
MSLLPLPFPLHWSWANAGVLGSVSTLAQRKRKRLGNPFWLPSQRQRLTPGDPRL